MARPEKNTVDYFPFICSEGKKMYYLEETYGNDGFATFVKLLRELANTNYHYLDLSKNTTKMFLSAKCKITKDVLENIIQDLVELGKFDKELWNEYEVIWCQDFIDSIQDAYKKRSNKCFTKKDLRNHLLGLSNPKLSLSESEGDVKPQRKEKKTIEEKSRRNTREEKALSDDSFFNIDTLMLNYLEDKKLCNAFIENQKLKDETELKSLLLKFNKQLTSTGQHSKTWKDYSTHFLNWSRKAKKISTTAAYESGKLPRF